jgi:dipeptidyl aminopeptidase/acylaminoacyl peptidase
MIRKPLCLTLAIFLAFLSSGVATATLTQEGYKDLSQYSGLTNFDMDEDGYIYAIADRKSGATLIRLDGEGNELASYGVTDGVEEITVSPSGGAVFYRVSGVDMSNRVYSGIT